MRDLPPSITALDKRFVWTRDGRLDGWRVLRGGPMDPLMGDCDDFAATALAIECGGSWLRFWARVLTFRAVFWLAYVPSGARHVMLWHRGLGWIDNTHPAWGPRACRRIMPIPAPIVAAKLLIGKVTG
jgi:hypothetical protein